MKPNPAKFRAEPCGCGCGQLVYVLKWAKRGVRRVRHDCAQTKRTMKGQ